MARRNVVITRHKDDTAPLLEVEGLKTHFLTEHGSVRAVDGVSFTLERGRTLGIVGESGSGKTVLARSLMGLVPTKNMARYGTVRYEGAEISSYSPSEMRSLWGTELSMIFQDPMTSLNPVMKVGKQITESLRYHLDMEKAEARETAISLLSSVGIPEPAQRMNEYPHQLSGGMRQRVMIAIALACGPRLLFADEPTTALDVTVQAQILDLLQDQQLERHMALILVTHDLGVVAARADEIAVMYAGKIVEKAPTNILFTNMKMPYTEALLKSIPKLEDRSHTRLEVITGRPPDLINPPAGCNFAPRCPYSQPKCHEEEPPLRTADAAGHEYACWYPVGTPEGAEALRSNLAAGLVQTQVAVATGAGDLGAAAALDEAEDGVPRCHSCASELAVDAVVCVLWRTDVDPVREPLMAGSGTAHLRDPEETLLRAEHLTVEFPVGRTGLRVHAVSDVSLDLVEGETLGVVGESGCGKSTTGRAIMQFPPPTAGEVTFDGRELTALEGEDLRRVRTQLQMIFQDPISSLNPRRRVGDIVAEPLAVWAEASTEERSTTSTFTAVLLFVAAGVLGLMGLITFIGGISALVGLVEDRFTFGPISVDASSGSALGGLLWTVLLAGGAMSTYSAGRAVWTREAGARSVAVLTVGGITALSLLAAAVLGTLLLPAIIGAVLLAGVAALLFSRPSQSDFPGVDDRAERRVNEVLEAVGLDPQVAKTKRPQEFSGGQCQRISIARALILDPQVIICDEPVSALDVSVQAQILNLLEDMKARYGLTLVFIAHDLAVVKNISDRVMVMYLGKTCEVGPPDTLYEAPAHPYTEALLSAIPVPDPAVRPTEDSALAGELPSPVAPPSGCRFRTRCPRAQDLCTDEEPVMRAIGTDHFVACHFPLIGEPD